jgi:hypothetical protein
MEWFKELYPKRSSYLFPVDDVLKSPSVGDESFHSLIPDGPVAAVHRDVVAAALVMKKAAISFVSVKVEDCVVLLLWLHVGRVVPVAQKVALAILFRIRKIKAATGLKYNLNVSCYIKQACAIVGVSLFD